MTNDSELLKMSALPPVTFLGEVSVEPLTAAGIIEDALVQVKDNLTDFVASSTFEEDILTVFGESADVDLGETIIDALAVGEDLPQITVAPVEQMNGASGGFDSLTGEVYLADSLMNESPLPVADVLTEELGHYIDSQLNRIDTPGDEGEHFAALVGGEVSSEEDVGRLRWEDDTVEILDGLVVVEADDSRATALDLGVIITQDIVVNDRIGFATGRSRDTTDYYRFELREESNVELTLERLSRDANLSLLDSYGSTLFQSSERGDSNEFIDGRLEAGVYYVLVRPSGSSKTEYRLSVSAEAVEIDPGSTPEQAINLGQLVPGKPAAVRDEIGFSMGRRSDEPDWYSFELEEKSEVELLLDQLRQDVNLRLHDDTGEALLLTSQNPGRQNEAIEVILDAGVYYVEASPAGRARTQYRLSVSAEELVIDPTPEQSINLGKFTPGKPVAVIDDIGFSMGLRRNSKDWYSFELEEDSVVYVALDQLQNNADLRLYNSNGMTVLTESRELGRKAEEIEATLPAGDYLLGVTAKGAAKTPYRLYASVQTQETTPPEISIGDTKIVEGNRGRKNAKFQVTLDAKPDETVRVNYATANKTAKANQDYKRTKGILTFKPGQTRKTITVPILGDTQIENNETFNLNLSKPKNAQLKDKRGIGTIRDNDFAKISIKDTEITEGNDGKKQAKFTVALNAKLNQKVEVSYATTDGTAKKGSDYQQTKGKLTFKRNQKQKTITVPILGDTLDEDNEKFSVNLSKPSKNVKLGDKRAIGTIKDNDDGGDKPGDSFQAAINLGKLTEEEVVVDEIGFTEAGDRDTNDFYRFQTDKEGNFVLTLDDLLKDANVDLYGSGEELINQSKNDDAQRETIVTVLDPGTYYVRVYPQGGDRTPYRLSVDLL